MPPSVAPEIMLHGSRCARHADAYNMRGFSGLMAMSTTPVESLTNSTFSHDLPPSRERKTPRSSFRPKRLPSAATYTRSGSRGCTWIFPIWPAARRPMCAHVFPLSVERYIPIPGDTLPRGSAEPVPT